MTFLVAEILTNQASAELLKRQLIFHIISIGSPPQQLCCLQALYLFTFHSIA